MSTLFLQDLLLAQYINTKITHDISNVCGALNQAVLCLNDPNKKIKEQAEDLIKNCSTAMTSRLQILREIYGISSSNNSHADLSRIKLLIKEVASHNLAKITLDWRLDEEEPNINSNLAKIILSLVVIAIKKLIYGGSIIVRIPEDYDVFNVVISAIGKNIVYNDNQNNIINSNADIELNVSNVDIIYIKTLAKVCNFSVSVEQEDNTIKYCVKQIVA